MSIGTTDTSMTSFLNYRLMNTSFEEIAIAQNEVFDEIRDAVIAFPAMRSPHEGYAIILEELDELWEIVKQKPPEDDKKLQQRKAAMRKEAKQVAAMALRFMADLT